MEYPKPLVAQRRPTLVNCVQTPKWDEPGWAVIEEFCGEALQRVEVRANGHHSINSFLHSTVGRIKLGPNDWIIRSSGGDFYPWSAREFATEYEVVETDVRIMKNPMYPGLNKPLQTLIEQISSGGAPISYQQADAEHPVDHLGFAAPYEFDTEL